MRAPGPRDAAGVLAFDAVPYLHKPLLDDIYYGAMNGLDFDVVVMYSQAFTEALDKIDGCNGTISQADYTALVTQLPLSQGRLAARTVRERLTNPNRSFGAGLVEAQQSMQPAIDGALDAPTFFGVHGCSSSVANKIFGNLQTWVEKQVIGGR